MRPILSFSLLCALLLLVGAQNHGLGQSQPLVVPDGTQIVVRLIDSLDSKRAAMGEKTRASADAPVVLGDVVAIRKGSNASITLIRSQDGKNNFIKLESIEVKGKTYPVSASYAEVKAGVSGGKVAKKSVGLGAAGALIGGIASGGKGAAIGAASGAGLGALVGAGSKSGDVKLASETLLSFVLRTSLNLD